MTRTTLGDLQSAIMAVLWERGEASVADVHTVVGEDRGLAFTTIATMLRKMEEKGVVEHRRRGRQFLYRPTVSEREVRSSMVRELLDRVFAGDPAALVSHLIAEREIDAEELDDLRRRLERLDRDEEG